MTAAAEHVPLVIPILAAVRLVLCLISLPFAVRAGYWFLSGLIVLGALAAFTTILGLSWATASAIATPLYFLLALHTLDISRRRHPDRPPHGS